MTLEISRAAHQAMITAALADPMREVCGLMLRGDNVVRILPTRNLAADPARAFEIDPATLFAAIRAERGGGETLIGYYHSHPSGSTQPSERDRQQAQGDGRIWLIIGTGRVAAWRMTESGQFESVVVKMTD